MMLESNTVSAAKPTRSPVELLSLDLDADRMQDAASIETIPTDSAELVRELVTMEDGARFERIQVENACLWVACC